jgi:hypothetical protein
MFWVMEAIVTTEFTVGDVRVKCSDLLLVFQWEVETIARIVAKGGCSPHLDDLGRLTALTFQSRCCSFD